MTTDAATDKTLRNLIFYAAHADVDTRDQFQPANAPHIAPGWNSLTVIDVITEALLQEASDNTGIPIDEQRPDLTDEEIDKAVPGFTALVNKAVASHITSPNLHAALQLSLFRFFSTTVALKLTGYFRLKIFPNSVRGRDVARS